MKNQTVRNKLKRRFNAKGRNIVDTVIDNSQVKKIKLDLSYNETKFDECNAFVLPGKKRTSKKVPNKQTKQSFLSNKQRKRLEKIVERKEKKAKRSSLLADLEEVQVDPKELDVLTKLQSTQTLGRKKFLSNDYTLYHHEDAAELDTSLELTRIRCVRGKKKNYSGLYREKKLKNLQKQGNVIDLGASSSEPESDNSSEHDDEQQPHCDVKGSANQSPEQKSTHPELENAQPAFIQKQYEVSQDEPFIKKSDIVETQVTGDVTAAVRSKAATFKKPATFVPLSRTEEVQSARLKLPILSEEHAIMEAISENQVTVIVGPTGSGKTTQVPQFLYEAGYGLNGKMIGVTEPRRVAAITMSERVAYEMNLTSREVSYQIRFEGNTTDATKIKFMTDGILMKEIQMDPSLRKYSVIIVDEAHERSAYSDILIGILSRVVPKRASNGNPLKLVIMSATLRVEDFTENKFLFRNQTPPVIQVESRMFDVSIHFNKRTPEDYVEEALKKVAKIHQRYPEGGILVFLTGQKEVNHLCRSLRQLFPFSKNSSESQLTENSYQRYVNMKREERKERKTKKMEEKVGKPIILPEVKLDFCIDALPDDAEADAAESDGSDVEDSDLLPCAGSDEQPLYVLPLYSMLPPEQQRKVFLAPSPGSRLCVVATNIAETSLTIPNIKYVVDSGKTKEKVYDKVTGVSMFNVTWASQASASQRAGRAGRTSPGHCFRLYSSAVFTDEFPKFNLAEIQRRPIDDLILVMKSMKLPVVNFPFPTPPDKLQIHHGIRRLTMLGALKEDSVKVKRTGGVCKDASMITPLGKAMAAFPVAPRYGKMLALSSQHNMMPFTVIIVAALSIQELLMETGLNSNNEIIDCPSHWKHIRSEWAGKDQGLQLGDPAVLMQAVIKADANGVSRMWCDENGIRYKALVEIRKLRRQLVNEINLLLPEVNLHFDPSITEPTRDQYCLLRQIVLSGCVDRVARRIDLSEIKDPEDRRKWKNGYRTLELVEPVFLSTSCVLNNVQPEWLIYQEIQETNKLILRNVTAIEPEWLAVFTPSMCNFSPPLEDPPPKWNASAGCIMCYSVTTYGPSQWPLPDIERPYPDSPDLYKWFAFFLLKGEVCPLLAPFSKYLHEPRTLISPVALRFREKREKLIRALMSHGVASYHVLESVWKEKPTYLLSQYLEWLEDETFSPEVKKCWPPLVKPEEIES